MSNAKAVIRASVLGTLVGGATGFALGVLLAPDEGVQVRRRVAFLLGRWSRQVARLVDRLDNAPQANDARETGAALVADAREQAQQLLREADVLMSEVRGRRDG